MKKLLTATALITVVSTATAFDLDSYNETNGYWGSDALSPVEALNDRIISGLVSRNQTRESFLADYNEANGYNDHDALSYQEMLRDRLAGSHRHFDQKYALFNLRGTLNGSSVNDEAVHTTKAERSQSMMFVNTRITDDQGNLQSDPNRGEAVLGDDDC